MKEKIILLLFMLLFTGVYNGLLAQDTVKIFKGYVYHQDGTPFVDALVNYTVKDSAKQTTTDENGYYEVSGCSNCKLVISYPEHYVKFEYPDVNRITKTYLINTDRYSVERTYFNGIQDNSLRNSPASVTLIQPKEHVTEKVTVDDEWRGLSSGMYSSKQSGIPGSGSLNIIRGIHSIHTTVTPSIVLDGMYIGDYYFSDPVIQGNTLFTLLGIDPGNVQEVVFLKDGASTLKYGIRGGNGVILINTINPTVKKTEISAGFSSGVSIFNKELPLLNAEQNRKYLQIQAYSQNTSINPIGPDVDPGEYPRWGHNTNWQNELFNPAMRNNLDFSFSGGDEISKFYFSIGYSGNKGTIKNTNTDRLNARLNANVAISKKVSLKMNIGFGYSNSNLFDFGLDYVSNPIYASFIKTPLLSTYEAVDIGIYQSTYDPEDLFGFSNPAAILNNVEAKRINYFLASNLRLNYQITNNLYINGMVGNNLNQLDDDEFIPDNGIGSLPASEAKQTVRKSDNKAITWSSNIEAGYHNLWDKVHEASFKLGVHYTSNEYSSGTGESLNTGSDDFQSIQYGKSNTRHKDGIWLKDKWGNSYLLSDYNYKQKYFVSAGVNLDRSSRFGNDIVNQGVKIGSNVFALGYSASVAWDIARENTKLSNWFEMFKIRGGYSLRGNDLFDQYLAKGYYVPKQYYIVTGLIKGGVMNSGIAWEKSKNVEAGIDIEFKGEKVGLSVNYFQENVNNAIASEELSGFYGFASMYTNSGNIMMNGVEASIRAFILNRKKFSWETELYLTNSKSVIKGLPNDEIIAIQGATKINRKDEAPLSFYGYKYNGVFATEDDAEAAGLTDEFGRPFRAGDAIFKDLDNNHIIDKNDKIILGNPMPEFWGSWINRFKVGSFGIYTRLSFNYGNEVFNYTRSKLEGVDNYFNQTTHVLRAWVREGDETDMPRINYGDPMENGRFSSRWIEDGSFVRISDITLSYDFKFKESGIRGLQVYLSGKNLFVFTDYLGYDPEFSYGLDMVNMGVDYFSAPVSASYLVGVKVDF